MLSVSIIDEKEKLAVYNIWINDVPLYGKKGFDLRNLNSSAFKQKIKVELSAGKNKIQVAAINQSGIESAKETQYTNCTVTPSKPSLYLVNIGISKFSQQDYNLDYASKDAKDISTFFGSKIADYTKINTFTITDIAATRDALIKLRDNLKLSKVDDIVVLSIASHGLLDDSLNYYMATTDIDFANPSTKGLSYSDFESIFDQIPARKKLVLIDACNSGEVDKESGDHSSTDKVIISGEVKARGFKKQGASEGTKRMGLSNSYDLMKELFADLRKGTGAIVISSASGKEFAFESNEWKNGVFTYSFLEGLKSKNADEDKNGTITVSEIRNYVIKRVQELTKGQQNPTSRADNIENNFVIW